MGELTPNTNRGAWRWPHAYHSTRERAETVLWWLTVAALVVMIVVFAVAHAS